MNLIGAVPREGVTPSDLWIEEHVRWLEGWDLKPFQLEILRALLGGGLMSVLLPTDYGKSTLLKLSIVLSLILKPKQPNIVVKISDEAAQDCLQQVSLTLDRRVAEAYPYCKPRVRWQKTGFPYIGKGFMIEGGDWDHVDRPSVYGASIWTSDLQGRRGRAHVDDIETEKEGRYEKFRQRLEARVSSVLRAIEDRGDFLFAFFGTPQHTRSVYFNVVDSMKNLGQQFRILRYPWKDEETGQLLWPERSRKVEIHRLAMRHTPFAFQVAYELRPVKSGKVSWEEIEQCKDKEMPYCRTRVDFENWLRATYDNADHLMASAKYYLGYDPSAGGQWAAGVICIAENLIFLLDASMQPGGIYDQLGVVQDLWERYGHPPIVIENNGQQGVIREFLMAQMPDADVYRHNSVHNIKHPSWGVPSFTYKAKEGTLHMPYGDIAAKNITDMLSEEIKEYDPDVSHPHLLCALWFPFYFHRKYVELEVAPREEREVHPLEAILPLPTVLPVADYDYDPTDGAWSRAV